MTNRLQTLSEISRAEVAGKLPVPMRDTASIWTGKEAYVVGGTRTYDLPSYRPSENELKTTIMPRETGSGFATLYSELVLSYTPETRKTKVVATLPAPKSNVLLVHDGKSIYIIGGNCHPKHHRKEKHREIRRLDTGNNTTEAMKTKLPEHFSSGYGFAFWDGERIVILDHRHGSIPPVMHKYDPSSDRIETSVEARLDPDFLWGTIVWDGETLHSFGLNPNHSANAYMAFNPSKNKTTQISENGPRVPHPQFKNFRRYNRGSAISTRDKILVFGGVKGYSWYPGLIDGHFPGGDNLFSNLIIEVDPEKMTGKVIGVFPDFVLSDTSAVWNETKKEAYIFGGHKHTTPKLGSGEDSADIFSFNPKK